MLEPQVLPRSRPIRKAGFVALAAAALSLGATAPSAVAHGASPHTGHLTERQLHAYETRTLGAEHAAEHAHQRYLLHDPKARAARARVMRTATKMRLRAAAVADPAQDGQWATPFDDHAIGIHAAVLPTGKVLWFYRNGDDVQNGRAALYDPVTQSFKQVTPPLTADGHSANIFCAGQSLLPDGRLLVMGGQIGPDPSKDPALGQEFKGLNAVYTFNPFDETWTRQPDMAGGRWYPTQVLTPDGRTLVMSGYDANGVAGAPQNPDIEVFTPSPDLNGVGTVTRVGHRGGPGEAPAGGLYPHLFTLPSGRTFVAGPRFTDSWFLNPLGDATVTWSDAADPRNHAYGNGVILPNDTPGAATKVELIAGGQAAGTDNQVYDEANPAAGWVTAAPLNVPRSHANTVLLPDASMVTVGGGTGDVNGSKAGFTPDDLFVELFDPATKTWRKGAMEKEARAYHSTALLLPDGRVISAGDDTNGGNNKDTAEIYSPPYLFKGARPSITAAPAAVGYGQSFSASFSGSDVAKAVMVAPGAATHANDMSQRYVPLTVTAKTAGSVTLTAPSGGSIAPPGYYMLFLLNAQGVPSVAKFVKVGSGVTTASQAPATPVPPVTTTPAATTPPPPSSPPPAGATPPATMPSQPTTVPAKPTGPSTTPPAKAPSELVLDELLRTPSIARQTLGRLVSRGLQVSVKCARTCTVRGEVRIDRRTAVRLGLARKRTGSATVLIGKGSLRVAGARSGRLAVKLSAAARRRVPRTKTLVLRLRLVATDSEGTTESVSRKLTLKR